jgi:dephospho-CoA kinase
VGLTGNIAAGKSTVAEVWQSLGSVVIDADVLARRAVEPGTAALRAIVKAWGPNVLNSDGSLDRAALRRIVFADAAARERLERIVHPAVGALRAAALENANEAGERLIVADIPLLFETGMQDEFDCIVLVHAPVAERLRRIVENRRVSRKDAERMLAAQMPSETKQSRADIVIDNTGTVDELRQRAGAVWKQLLALAAARGNDDTGSAYA